jgi:integrase/recombinase XerD
MKQRIDAFLGHLAEEREVSANTVAAYRNDLTQFAEFLNAEAVRQGLTGLPLSSVDRERLAGYLLYLRERGYAPASVARKVAAIKTFFHYLRRAGEVAADPTEGLGAPEVKKAPPRAIGDHEVRRLFEWAERRDTPEGRRDGSMLRMLYATGMRVSELMMLDVADVQLADAAVRVAGRGGRSRLLPLDLPTIASLRSYIDQARPYLVRHDPSQTAFFVNHRGQRLTRQGFWLILKALVKDCGLAVVVTPHTLRHSFATHRLAEGVALAHLQHLLGHASISTTQVYTQLTPKQQAVPATPHIRSPEPEGTVNERPLVSLGGGG